MKYGAMTETDAGVLEQVLQEHKAGGSLKFLEIGVHEGNTARGVRDWCAENGVALEYWGIESGVLCDPKTPFYGAHFVQGESWDVFFKVPDDFDVILVDGCHTFNGVVLDIMHYAPKVDFGGFLLFHDVAPHLQYKLDEPNRNYPEHPLFHNAVNDALTACGFPVSGEMLNGISSFPITGNRVCRYWSLWASRWDAAASIGGMAAFKRGIYE